MLILAAERGLSFLRICFAWIKRIRKLQKLFNNGINLIFEQIHLVRWCRTAVLHGCNLENVTSKQLHDIEIVPVLIHL
jgi:hypothetical protein